MSMNEFRRLAAKMDQHMQQLSAQGVNDAHAIINRMMGYVPDLHKIWVGTSDDQLIALSNEFPGFYRYALVMEEASEAERKKASRPYDGMAQFSEHHKQLAAQLLTTAATLERGYQACRGSGNLRDLQVAATRRVVEVATCKSLSLKSTRWVSCIGNGFPIWKTSRTPYERRAQNPGYWST